MDTHAIVVWLVTGLFAGSLAGVILNRKREGFGWMLNLVSGLLGAFVGGFLFDALSIDLGLGQVTIQGDAVVAAFVGAILVVFVAGFVSAQREKHR